MSTNEQITALLHGELTNDRSVAELMHILSVSPEKRTVFLEHINVTRQLLRAGEGLTPAPSVAQGVWAKIAALENPAPLASPPIPLHTSAEQKSDRRKWGLLLLLLFAFTGGGYLLGLRNADASRPDELEGAAPPVQHSVHSSASATTPPPAWREETAAVEQERTEEKIAAAQNAPAAKGNGLQTQVTELRESLKGEREKNNGLMSEITRLRSVLIELEKKNAAETPAASASAPPYLNRLQSGAARELPLISSDEEKNLQRIPSTSAIPTNVLPHPTALPERAAGPWRIEMRQHLRSSLPGVNGLEEGAGLLSDREVGLSFSFTAMNRAMRLGTAVGGTTFAQVYHTNTGGALNDTIIEQAPRLTYGRAYVAPSIFEGEKILGSLELGVGATELGPIGTAGLNLEYRVADRLTFQAGVSSWLLWTSFRDQLHTSTNLNAHIGVSLNP